jgi:nitrogen regulatory protein PII-like uncharacterized protein
MAEDAEDAIKRVRDASKHTVVRIGSVVFIAALDLCPNDPDERPGANTKDSKHD